MVLIQILLKTPQFSYRKFISVPRFGYSLPSKSNKTTRKAKNFLPFLFFGTVVEHRYTVSFG